MPKRILTIAAACATLAACGDSKESTPPLFGGFTPASAAAVILAPASCNVPFLGTTGVSGIVVYLTRGADACSVLTQAQLCGSGAGSTTVVLGALTGAVGGVVGATLPASYPFLAQPPTGTFRAAIATAAQVDAVCSGAPTDMSGGSITISAVTGSNVAGSADVHFDNGQVFEQAFDVTLCNVSIPTCSLFQPCTSYVCVQ